MYALSLGSASVREPREITIPMGSSLCFVSVIFPLAIAV
jgi:hypothetical protein